jgi:transcriptional regulator with XRE-family HTH domain
MPRTTGTKAEREHVRMTMAGYGVAPPVIAAELQRRFGLRPREAHRQAHGWTQDVVAGRLNARSGSAGFTGARVSDYERFPYGGRRPTLPVLAALAAVYGTTATVLVDLDDLESLPEADRAILCASADTGIASATRNVTEPVGNVGGPGWTPGNLLDDTELVITLTERTSMFGAWAESSNVGPLTLDDIGASTRRIARDYLTKPPLEVYARAGLLTDRVFRLLQNGRQSPDEARELYSWAGYLCALLAWMAGDLGHPGAAESQARTAWICAEKVADDNTLRAWVLSVMSKIYLWDQRYEEAASAAARGFALAPSGSAGVLLACQEADAYAELGCAATDRARQTLARVEVARNDIDGDDAVGGVLSCDLVRQHNYTGAVLLRGGDLQGAVRHAEQAFHAAAATNESAYGTVAQIRIWAASAHLQSAETANPGNDGLGGARDVLAPVLELPVDRRLAPVIRRMRDVDRLITANARLRDNSEARQLHAEMSEFCASGAANQLPH